MITVVLVGSESAGNVGSVARAMANFGVRKLVLVAPQCAYRGVEARKRAMHASRLLSRAVVVPTLEEALAGVDYAVATTGMVGSDYNLLRSPLTPEQLAAKVKDVRRNIALVFGRESSGLKNAELLQCDFTVTVPATRTYPILNLASSVAVILYVLFRERTAQAGIHAPMGGKEKRIILTAVDVAIERLRFSTAAKKETQRRLWRRMVSKALLTRREAFALLGFLRKVK